MFDFDMNMEIVIVEAKAKRKYLVGSSKMDQQTSDTYWKVLLGTENRYGCVKRINDGECVVSHESVAKYTDDEGYELSVEDGYWYATTPLT